MSQFAKKGFRRFLPLIILAAITLLAAAFVLLLPVIKQNIPANSAAQYEYNPTYKTIAQRDADTLQSITVSHVNGEPYTLIYQNDILFLVMEDGDPEPVNTIFAENFIKYATTFSVEDTVTDDVSEVADFLPDMGLDPPQIQADITYTDGSTASISLGTTLPGTSYHYYRWSGDDAVYLCNSGIYETLEYTAEMLLTFTQPLIIPALIERVSIARENEKAIVCVFRDAGGDTLEGALESPFTYPMDTGAAEDLLAAVQNFRLGARLKPVTDETRAQYGLDTPQAVVEIAQGEGLYTQVDENGAMQSIPLAPSTVTLTIGGRDGDFFYFCAFEGVCYRVSGFLVAAFLQADAAAYLSATPADLGTGNMQSIEVQTGDGTLNLRAVYAEQVLPNNELATDEDGNVLYTMDVTANGEPVSAESFLLLTQRLAQLTVSGSLDAAQSPDGTPRWQLTLATAQGKTRTLSAYPMDAFHDILAVDGVALSYSSNEALEIALGEFAALVQASDTP